MIKNGDCGDQRKVDGEGRRNMHISCNLQKGEKPREPNELLLRLLCTNVHDRSINAILSVPFTN
jgi:hypothetical protein